MSTTEALQETAAQAQEQEGLSQAEQRELQQYRQWIFQAAHVCQQAAGGNLESRLLNIDDDLEGDLAEMLHSINSMLDYTDAFVRESKAALDSAAQGRFFRRVMLRGMPGTFNQASKLINSATYEMERQNEALEASNRERLEMADDFETKVKDVSDSLAAATTEMFATSRSLSQSARDTEAQSTVTLQASKETVQNVQNVAEAAENLNEAVEAINSQAQDSKQVVRQAVQEAKSANDIVVGLEKSSATIGDVVQMISEVAKQTHLLGLNASIEAARAGDAGRGFAIVATEVRKLADQTKSSTERVEKDIKAIQQATQGAVETISKFRSTIGQVDEISECISNSVSQQSDAATAINRNTSEVAQRSEEVSGNIAQVCETVGEMSCSSENMQEAAQGLSAQAESLNGAVDDFLSTIRGE